MEIPRLGGKSELQLLAYTTATATLDLSHICDLHCSLWQCWILNPLTKARDRTCVLMDTSQICFCWATTGTPQTKFSNVVSVSPCWLNSRPCIRVSSTLIFPVDSFINEKQGGIHIKKILKSEGRAQKGHNCKALKTNEILLHKRVDETCETVL